MWKCLLNKMLSVLAVNIAVLSQHSGIKTNKKQHWSKNIRFLSGNLSWIKCLLFWQLMLQCCHNSGVKTKAKNDTGAGIGWLNSFVTEWVASLSSSSIKAKKSNAGFMSGTFSWIKCSLFWQLMLQCYHNTGIKTNKKQHWSKNRMA